MKESCSSISRGGWRWSFGQRHCVRAPQLVRGFETLTQWLNLLGSKLILQWFSSATPASSDFSKILYALSSLIWRTMKPWQRDIYTSQRPTNHSYIHVHTNSCSRTQMLYISTFWKSCVYTRLTGHFLCPKHYHKHIHLEQSGGGRKLQFQRSKMLFLRVGKGLFHCWHAALLPIAQIKRPEFTQPCNLLCYTHAIPHLWLYTGWLFREAYIFCFQDDGTL